MHDFRQWWDTVWAQAVHDQQLLGTHAFEVNRAKLAARRVRVTRDHRRSYGKCHRISSHTGVAASPCAMATQQGIGQPTPQKRLSTGRMQVRPFNPRHARTQTRIP